MSNLRVGFGYDVHRLGKNLKMYLAGIEIESDYGFIAHSDGDVLLHSVMDAILGAAGMGDIGEHFPEYDSKYKDIDSKKLFLIVLDLVTQKNFQLINIDIAITLEKPKIRKYKPQMIENIAKLSGLPIDSINIKATTNEQMGFVGRGEGAAVYAVCLLEKK